MAQDSAKTGGIGFFGLLTIALIVLKLTHYITWSWWWVLAVASVPLAFWIGVVVIAVLIINRKRNKKWRK